MIGMGSSDIRRTRDRSSCCRRAGGLISASDVQGMPHCRERDASRRPDPLGRYDEAPIMVAPMAFGLTWLMTVPIKCAVHPELCGRFLQLLFSRLAPIGHEDHPIDKGRQPIRIAGASTGGACSTMKSISALLEVMMSSQSLSESSDLNGSVMTCVASMNPKPGRSERTARISPMTA